MVIELLTSALLETIVKGIFSVLGKKKASEDELRKIRDNLEKLVKLDENTGNALDRFVDLLKSATRAAVHATELRNCLEKDQTPNSALVESGKRLLEDRVLRELRKDALPKIRQFDRDYYERASDIATEASDHLKESVSNLKNDNAKQAVKELEYAVDKLDKLVESIGTRIDEILQPLTESYQVLIEAGKR